MDTESIESPRKHLCELVGEEVARQTSEREEIQAYSDLPEPGHTPANPGQTFANRVTRRIQQARFEQ